VIYATVATIVSSSLTGGGRFGAGDAGDFTRVNFQSILGADEDSVGVFLSWFEVFTTS
jgi:hypothetical protein